MKKVVFTTGGTGGHIYPALSIAKKMKNENVDILFIGTEHRMEKDLIPKENFSFIGLDVIPISIKKPLSLLKIGLATIKAMKILKTEKVDKIIGFGNYISLPTLISARLLKIPYYLQEQNCLMGMANKYFYKKAKKVFIAFENTLEEVENKYKHNFVVTGNPLREEFYTKNKVVEREKLGIKEDEKVIMIMGGSLGAKNINSAINKNWDKILKDEKIKVFWATGKDNYQEATHKIKNFGNNVVEPYFHNAADIMAAADLILCRAGASTISELIQLEKPSILIPYDFVGQKENADVLEFINAAKIFTNETVDKAIDEAITLVKQQDMLNFMQENIIKIKKGNAAEQIIKEMEL